MTRLLSLSPPGLYCAAGGFHIDPWQPVDRALITHAHADHLDAAFRAVPHGLRVGMDGDRWGWCAGFLSPRAPPSTSRIAL